MKKKRIRVPVSNRVLLKFLKIMRLSVFFLLLFVAQTFATATYSQQTRLTLKMQDAKVIDVLTKIEDESEFFFLFNQKLVDVDRQVTVDAKNESIDKILAGVFENTNVTALVKDRQIILTTANPELVASEQQKSVSGKVTDSSGASLPGVSVVIKGTTSGTITDANGNYSIKVPENATLQFSFVGMKSQEFAVSDKTSINVTLVEEAIGIEEVVAVGYGTVKRSDMTGSISSISADKIIQGPATSVSRALQGKSAGVRVTQKTGRPGDEVIIRVRGGNSLSGGNDPLYVVDGFPVDRLGADFNPEDISSMEILKDASATAIYGSRGANGVVIITTKRGKDGKGEVSYHGYYGVQSLRKKLDLLDKNQYVAMQNEIATKEGGTILSSGQIANLPDNNWQDLAYRNAMMQSHQLEASGGTQSARFFSSLNYMNQEGILKGSDYNRLGIRVNGDIQINKKLNVKSNIGFTRTLDNNGNFSADGYGAIPFQSIVMPPTDPIYDETGKYTVFKGTPWGGTNPVGYSQMAKNLTTFNRVIANTAINYEFIKGLDLKISLGVDFNEATNDIYNKIGISNGGPGTGEGSKSMSKSYTLVNENILNYSKTINENNRFSAMGGFSYQENVSDNISSGAYSGFVSDVFENNNLQSAKNTKPVATGYSDAKLISYIGRFNYSLKERYLLTLTGRYDGSSKFGADNKYAFFPSAALAWRMSEENFIKQFEWISNLKVRASLGQAGNQAISPYQTLDRLTTNVPVFGTGQRVGFVASGFSNQGLKWETTTQADLGLDFSILENRVGLVMDYYKKNTTDLLYNASLPPSSGYSSSIRNVGEIENKGFEFELSYHNLKGEIKWNTSLNMSFNRSKVVDLGTDNSGTPIQRIDSPIAGGNWFPLFLNESPSQLYGFVIDGIYQTDAEAAVEPGKKAGDYKIKDLKADGVINGDDQTLLTHLEPKFVIGMNNEISYKNFDLSFLIVGSYGNDIVNEFNKYYTALGGTWNVTKEAWNNRWTGPGSTGTYAAASSHAPSYITFGSPSTLWVENGSYLKVKDIKLAYTIPSSVTKRIKIENVTVYVSGSNLLTWTNYKHYDPEASWTSSSVNGWDRGVYPSAKAVMGGIQVTF
jgi:TonB-dependent starch-binding outer membrane protein SusC